MRHWNPFGKVDMEIGSFIKTSRFNKDYTSKDAEKNDQNARETPDSRKHP